MGNALRHVRGESQKNTISVPLWHCFWCQARHLWRYLPQSPLALSVFLRGNVEEVQIKASYEI